MRSGPAKLEEVSLGPRVQSNPSARYAIITGVRCTPHPPRCHAVIIMMTSPRYHPRVRGGVNTLLVINICGDFELGA